MSFFMEDVDERFSGADLEAIRVALGAVHWYRECMRRDRETARLRVVDDDGRLRRGDLVEYKTDRLELAMKKCREADDLWNALVAIEARLRSITALPYIPGRSCSERHGKVRHDMITVSGGERCQFCGVYNKHARQMCLEDLLDTEGERDYVEWAYGEAGR